MPPLLLRANILCAMNDMIYQGNHPTASLGAHFVNKFIPATRVTFLITTSPELDQGNTGDVDWIVRTVKNIHNYNY